MRKIIILLLPLLILGTMAFSNQNSIQTVQPKRKVDTLLQVQLISKQEFKKGEWKKFKAQHYFNVVDSSLPGNKQLVHGYQKRNMSKGGKIEMSRFTPRVPHAWGLLQKVGKKWELSKLFVAPTHMQLQIQDTTDFNGDLKPELIIRWNYSHHYNHEFGTGRNKQSGIYIWDVANTKNLLSLMLTSSGNGWNMCRGKGSQYSNHYYDIKIKNKMLLVMNYTLSKLPKSQVYLLDKSRFKRSNQD